MFSFSIFLTFKTGVVGFFCGNYPKEASSAKATSQKFDMYIIVFYIMYMSGGVFYDSKRDYC